LTFGANASRPSALAIHENLLKPREFSSSFSFSSSKNSDCDYEDDDEDDQFRLGLAGPTLHFLAKTFLELPCLAFRFARWLEAFRLSSPPRFLICCAYALVCGRTDL